MHRNVIVGSATGMKALSVDQFFDYLKTVGEERKSTAAYSAVAWVFRCVNLRADAVSSIPFMVKRGQTEIEWPIPLKRLLWKTEAALLISGAAYWLKQERETGIRGLQYRRDTPMRLRDLRWLNPRTVKPITDARAGITGFQQQVSGRQEEYAPEEIVYFRLFNPDDDLGPGVSPLEVVANAASLADAANRWADAFFEHGAIPAVILSTEHNVPDAELERLRTTWNRFVGGVKKAWRTIVLRRGLKPTIVGMPVKDLAMPELMDSVRNQIAVAFGVPQTMLTDAANYATSREHRISFWQETIIPEATLIEEMLNKQLFGPMNLEISFAFESLEQVQQDEGSKAEWLGYLFDRGLVTDEEVRAAMGLPPLAEAVGQVVGDRSQGSGGKEQVVEVRRLGAGIEGQVLVESVRDDLRRWRTKVKKRGGSAPFESQVIPGSLRRVLEPLIAERGVEAFSFLKQVSEGQGVAEGRLRDRVAEVLDEHLDVFVENINTGQGPDYDAFEKAMQSAIEPELARAATEQALRLAVEIGVEFDVAVINAEALAWARQYTFELVKGITDRTRKVVSSATQKFIETPGMTVEQLRELLEPAFGPVRAEMIATTEVTRAYAQATNVYQQQLAAVGVEMWRVWNTSADERVCPICGPLGGELEGVWAESHPGGPPAHVRCRCWTTLELVKR